MSDLSVEERAKLAVKFVEQAPPGEVNDVINDIRTIIGDDEALMPLILPSIRAYNLSQLTAVEHAEADGVPAHYSLLSEAAVVPGEEEERYVDATAKRSFKFDHASSSASDYQPYNLPEEEESFRAELAKSLTAYTKNHFPAGQSSVSCSQYPLLPEQPAQASTGGIAGASVPSTEGADAEISAETVADNEPAGDIEPLSTPKEGDVKAAVDEHVGEALEVDQPGGIEKLDEEMQDEKVKEDEAGKDVVQPVVASESVEASAEPSSTEAAVPGGAEPTAAPGAEEPAAEAEPTEATAASSSAPTTAASAPARQQEKVDNPVYTLEVVGNRYNPSNFWTGRWRTRWIVDQAKASVDGTIQVDVHYYEQGNVQLAARHTASFPVPQASGSQSVASQIVTTISKMEAAYQMELNDVYGDLGDKAFRALRRALPLTRQKMDWDKVSGYSLGSDISKARAAA